MDQRTPQWDSEAQVLAVAISRCLQDEVYRRELAHNPALLGSDRLARVLRQMGLTESGFTNFDAAFQSPSAGSAHS